MSLTIVNGRLITPQGVVEAAVYAENGEIAWIGRNANAPKGDNIIDAKGMFVFPGFIDAHCHMRDLERSSFEDFETGTKSAAAGGVTCLYDMPTTIPPTSSVEGLLKKLREAERKAVVDFGLYGGAGSTSIDRIAAQAERGVIGFKTFTMLYPGREKDMEGLYATDDWSIFEVIKEVAKTGLYLTIHAENNDMVLKYQERAVKVGKMSLIHYAEERPDIIEAETALKAFYFASLTEAKVNIAHVSAKATVDVIRMYRRSGVNAVGETCPHYLLFTVEELNHLGPYGKVAPPIRSKKDREGLWQGIYDGLLKMIVSDHAPFNREMKERGRENVFLAQAGISGLQAMVPLMLTQVNRGMLSIEKLVELMAVNPAKFAGIYPKKGVIAVGSDADFTIIDLKKEWKINVDEFYTKDKAGATVYDGMRVTGKPVYTIVRGGVVAEEGNIKVEKGYGKLVKPLFPPSL